MRILFIRHGRFLFLDAVEHAWRGLGVELRALDMEDPAFLERLVGEVVTFAPDCLFTIPISPQLSMLSAALKKPVVHWELDKLLNRQWLSADSYTPQDIVFSTYREDVAWLNDLGVTAFYLPFAANIRHHGHQGRAFRWDVSFVGRLEWAAERRYRHYLAEFPDPARAEAEMEGLLARLLHPQPEQPDFRRLVQAQQAQQAAPDDGRSPPPDPFFVASLLAKEGGRRKRAQQLLAIPEVALFGPPEWQQLARPGLTPLWEPPQYTDSGAIFHQSRVNLSITRPHAMDGLTDRVFNVLFSGGFLLTDRTEALLERFRAGEELETYGSVEEMNDKIRHYLAHEARREAIARRGNEAAHARHAFPHRLREMLTTLQPLLH